MDALSNALSNAPPVADRLALDHEDLKAEITDALAALPEVQIASDADVLIARELVAPLKALQNRCVAAHKAEKQPYLDGGRAVDGFFKALRVHLDSVVALITEEASQYQTRKLALAREKAASEARIAAMLEEPAPAAPAPAAMTRVSDNGSVAVSGAVRWDYEITDEAALPRELLHLCGNCSRWRDQPDRRRHRLLCPGPCQGPDDLHPYREPNVLQRPRRHHDLHAHRQPNVLQLSAKARAAPPFTQVEKIL
jgi:hypothetical protein